MWPWRLLRTHMYIPLSKQKVDCTSAWRNPRTLQLELNNIQAGSHWRRGFKSASTIHVFKDSRPFQIRLKCCHIRQTKQKGYICKRNVSKLKLFRPTKCYQQIFPILDPEHLSNIREEKLKAMATLEEKPPSIQHFAWPPSINTQ